MGRASFIITIFIVLCAARPALAGDIVELKSGEKLEGRLTGESGSEIILRTNGTKLVLPKSMIKVMKIETVYVHLSDGRTLTGQVEKETDHSLVLRMKLGSVTLDKMDIDEIERKVVERKPVVTGDGAENGAAEDQIPGAQRIRWPRRTRRLGRREIEWLRFEASQYLSRKQYKNAAETYRKILSASPKDTMALYDIACAYALLGQVDKAVAHLRMAVAAGYTNFTQIERNSDFDIIRRQKGYLEVFRKRDEIQLQAARRELAKLKKRFGPGYTYEIDEERKLIFATNQSLEMLARLKEHLSRFADAQCRLVWDNRPSYYITVILPDREGFNKVVHNPSVAGYYMPGEKSLISLDIGQTLDHEFTHALHYADQDFKRIKAPTYIVEGFATLLQSTGMVGEDIVPRRTSGRFYEIREEVRRGEHTPWSRFCVMSYHQYHQKNRSMNYAQSRYMFVYLFETGRLRKWYLNYCEMYHRDQTGRAAWERTFCKPFGEIEKEWVEWLLSIKTAPRKVEKLGCPYLGVEWEDAENGVALYRVDLDSPADKSGLRDGDFLTHADGKEIRTYNDLIDFLNAHEPGDKVNLKVLRGAKELAVTVVLTEHP